MRRRVLVKVLLGLLKVCAQVAGSACSATPARVLVRVLFGVRVLFDVLEVRWPLVVLVWRSGRVLVQVRVLLRVLKLVWWLLSVIVRRCGQRAGPGAVAIPRRRKHVFVGVPQKPTHPHSSAAKANFAVQSVPNSCSPALCFESAECCTRCLWPWRSWHWSN